MAHGAKDGGRDGRTHARQELQDHYCGDSRALVPQSKRMCHIPTQRMATYRLRVGKQHERQRHASIVPAHNKQNKTNKKESACSGGHSYIQRRSDGEIETHSFVSNCSLIESNGVASTPSSRQCAFCLFGLFVCLFVIQDTR